MAQVTRAGIVVAAIVTAALISASASSGQTPGTPAQATRDEGDKKPSLSLRATPPIGFAPLRVRLVADLKGGADDFADLYCASVEWDWGDGTVSQSSEDCDPYEAGKSQIRRRFTADHTFRYEDMYRVFIRLKQKNRVVASSQANVQVRPGARDAY
jgi:hypothetical protein